MKHNLTRRNYNMHDSELCMFASNLCNFLTRDLSDFAIFGLTADKIATFKAIGDSFEIFPTDGSIIGDVMITTENKNMFRNKVIEDIWRMALRVEAKWGKDSGKYRRLNLRNPTSLTDDALLMTARTVHTKMTEYLVELADYGLTQSELDAFEALNEQFELAKNAQADVVSYRDEKTEERIILGNQLYDLVSLYCGFGKKLFEKTNPAKYNDYVIYTPSPGGLDAPQNLRFDYEFNIMSWDTVPNAASYQLEADTGSGFVEIYSGNAAEYAFTPTDGKTIYRARAHNSGGYSDYSALTEIWYYDILPAPANFTINVSPTNPDLIEFSWDAVPTADCYSVMNSKVGIGQPAGAFGSCGTVIETYYSKEFAFNYRYYFYVVAHRYMKTGNASTIVHVDLVA